MNNLAQAIVNVIKEVEGVEKNMNVGTGNSSYKGVSDYDVKKATRKSMAKNGLSLIPISIEPKVTRERWEEEDKYNGGVKTKQSVFTEVYTKYMLLHTSGESVEVSGYGHGLDSQDKSAGKATTYALKYALLYLFQIPTGAIDDADTEHSDNIEVPKIVKSKLLQELTEEHPNYGKVVSALSSGKHTIDDVKSKYTLSKELEEKLCKILK